MGRESKLEQTMVKYGEWLIRRRWPVLLVTLLAVGFAAFVGAAR